VGKPHAYLGRPDPCVASPSHRISVGCDLTCDVQTVFHSQKSPSLLENGGVHAELEFPNSEHAIRLVGPKSTGLHSLFAAKGSRGGELPPNHSLWREQIDFRVC